MHFPVSHSFSTIPGLVLWAARKAHWAIGCAALPSAPPDFNAPVTKWLGELRALLPWDPLKALRPSIHTYIRTYTKDEMVNHVPSRACLLFSQREAFSSIQSRQDHGAD